jgi:hypothetical protein
MKKILILIGLVMALLLITKPVHGQAIPGYVKIAITSVNVDTMQIKVTWNKLLPVPPSTTPAYDVIMWARPKIPIMEYFQVVTTDTTTYIRVLKSSVPDSTIVYAAVRSSVNPRRGAVTYRKP